MHSSSLLFSSEVSFQPNYEQPNYEQPNYEQPNYEQPTCLFENIVLNRSAWQPFLIGHCV